MDHFYDTLVMVLLISLKANQPSKYLCLNSAEESHMGFELNEAEQVTIFIFVWTFPLTVIMFLWSVSNIRSKAEDAWGQNKLSYCHGFSNEIPWDIKETPFRLDGPVHMLVLLIHFYSLWFLSVVRWGWRGQEGWQSSGGAGGLIIATHR